MNLFMMFSGVGIQGNNKQEKEKSLLVVVIYRREEFNFDTQEVDNI